MKAAGPGDTWDMVLIACDIDIVDHGWRSGWRMIMRMRPMLPKMVHAEVQSWKGEAQPCGRDLLQELDGSGNVEAVVPDQSHMIRFENAQKPTAYWIRSPSCKLADFVRIAEEVDGTGKICFAKREILSWHVSGTLLIYLWGSQNEGDTGKAWIIWGIFSVCWSYLALDRIWYREERSWN